MHALPPQPPALVAQAVPPRPVVDVAERRLTGRVTDARSGRPLAGVLVQQEDAVAMAFSEADGSFELLLDPAHPLAVSVSAAGYAARRLVVAGDRLDVRLSQLTSFVPTRPFARPPIMAGSASELAPFNSHLRASYILRHQDIAQNGSAISGNVTNEFELGARLRFKPWLAEAEVGHYQSHVDLPSLSASQNPAFKPSMWQTAVRAGYFWTLRPGLEGALEAGYRFRSVEPNNSNVPYTNTGLDVGQTAHAFGPVAAAAWKPFGKWVFQGSLGCYPLVIAYADDGSPPFTGSFNLDAKALAAYEITPGMRLGLGYEYDMWRGAGSDSSSVFSLQVHYTPGGLPQ